MQADGSQGKISMEKLVIKRTTPVRMNLAQELKGLAQLFVWFFIMCFLIRLSAKGERTGYENTLSQPRYLIKISPTSNFPTAGTFKFNTP